MHRLTGILLIIALLLFATTSFSQSANSGSSVQSKLESLRRGAMSAWQNKNADALKATMAPDFQFIGPQGVATRDMWLASLPHCSLSSYSMNDVQLHRVSAESAILTYKLHYVGDCDGHTIPADTVVADTFVRRHGRWWIVTTSFIPRQQ